MSVVGVFLALLPRPALVQPLVDLDTYSARLAAPSTPA